jgi:hypothetical protein
MMGFGECSGSLGRLPRCCPFDRLGPLLGLRAGKCKRSPSRRRPAGCWSNSRVVEHPPIITRREAAWAVFIVEGIVFLVGAAVLIGSALTALPLISGVVVAFAMLVLVAALVAVELRRFWARLPR